MLFDVASSRPHFEDHFFQLPFLASLWPQIFYFQLEKKKQESKGNSEMSDFFQAQVKKHFQLGKAVVGNHAYSPVGLERVYKLIHIEFTALLY